MPFEEIRARVASEAGNSPLFLSAFLDNNSNNSDGVTWTWTAALHLFRDSALCKLAMEHLTAFLNDANAPKQEVLDAWLACVAGSVLSQQQQDLCDPRYFYVDKQQCGRTVCGFISQRVVAMVDEQHYSRRLTENDYMNVIQSFVDNRAVQGFMLERSVLAFLQQPHVMRLFDPKYDDSAIKVVDFATSAPHILQRVEGTVLYKPMAFNYTSVDAVIRTIGKLPNPSPPPPRAGNRSASKPNKRAKTELTEAHITAVQITLQKVGANKKARTERFFQHVTSYWAPDLQPDKFNITFSLVYVVEKGQKVLEADKKREREGVKWDVKYVTLDAIDEKLVAALVRKE